MIPHPASFLPCPRHARRGSLRALGLVLSLWLAAVAAGCAGGSAATAESGPDARELAAIWDAERVSPPLPPLFAHDEVERRLHAVRDSAPGLFHLEEIGRSVEGRSISHLWFGRGPFPVLLWSQMHGDEPTATSALFDLYEYVRRRQDQPPVRRMLDALTIHTVPMLNPDGAERFVRRNAQGIDINRDALALQTPEGRALKALRDRLEPQLGFNLHNQSWRTSVGRPPRPASISLLAVAFDDERSVSEGRLLAMKVSGIIRDAVEPFAAGQIGRYDDEFEVRAFGDNITRWGTPVVLVETGPWSAPQPDPPLIRLNFVALVTALDALATGRARQADPQRYETLPMNESRIFHTLIREAAIVTGTGIDTFTGDIGIAATRSVREIGGSRRVVISSRVEDLGDLRVFGGLEVIDAQGLVAAPLLREDVSDGDRVDVPPRLLRGRSDTMIAPGQPAEIMLLRPLGGDAYRVVRVIRAQVLM